MKWFYILVLLCISVNTAFAQTELPNFSQIDHDTKFSYKERPRSDWRMCETDSDCELFYYGCYDVIAINKDWRQQAEKRYYERLHQDPRVLNCMRLTQSDYIGEIKPLCKYGRCGAWQHMKCLDPPKCELIYEERCMYEDQVFIDDTYENYGQNAQRLFALDDTMCAQKCHEYFEQRKEDFTELSPPRLVMKCEFNNEAVLKEEHSFPQDNEDNEQEEE